MGNEMNTEVSKVIQGQLDSVAIAVQEVTLLSSKVDDLARELHDHGKLSIDQLEEFKSATTDTQRTLDGLFQNLAKFDEFISAGSTVSQEIREGVIDLKTTLADTTASLSALLDRFGNEANASLDNVRKTSSELQSNFAVSVGSLQATLSDSKRQLNASVELLSTTIAQTVSQAGADLNIASSGLLQAAVDVRGQLNEMPQAVEQKILERVEPGLASFTNSLSEGTAAVTNATGAVTLQVAQVVEKSSEEISALIVKHDAIIKRHEQVSGDLQGFLSNASEFARMTTALQSNESLLVEIERGLSAREAPILFRLERAVLGVIAGCAVGQLVLDLNIAELLGPVTITAAFGSLSGSFFRSVHKMLSKSKAKDWTPPAPPN